MGYEAKTKPHTASVDEFIAAIPGEARRADAAALCALMQEVTGEPPVMWGPSIIGFGRYQYTYASGHSGQSCRIGFSPRKANLALYMMSGFDGSEALLQRLGKHRKAKSCLYLNHLAEVDRAVLREMAERAYAWMNQKHPPT